MAPLFPDLLMAQAPAASQGLFPLLGDLGQDGVLMDLQSFPDQVPGHHGKGKAPLLGQLFDQGINRLLQGNIDAWILRRLQGAQEWLANQTTAAAIRKLKRSRRARRGSAIASARVGARSTPETTTGRWVSSSAARLAK